jgi:hypothetical protein
MELVYKVGDYILTKDKVLYRIVNANYSYLTSYNYSENVSNYDIRSITKVPSYYGLVHEKISGLMHNEIKDLGKLIPEESASELLNILYSNNIL